MKILLSIRTVQQKFYYGFKFLVNLNRIDGLQILPKVSIFFKLCLKNKYCSPTNVWEKRENFKYAFWPLPLD